MPTGSVLEPDGPNAQATFGQIQSTNGKIYLFYNTADLKVNDPVIFDLDSGDATVNTKNDSYTGVLAVAVLPKKYNDVDENGKWNDPGLNDRWREDWAQVSELQLRNVFLNRDKVVNYKRYKQ